MGSNTSILSELQASIRNLEAENRELKKQIDSLKSINLTYQMESKIKFSTPLSSKTDRFRKAQQDKKEKIKEKVSDVSKEKIQAHVEKLLENPNTNIKYLPDFVEKQIYINIFSLVFNVLDDLLDTASVNFMGHQINFDLVEQQPKLDEVSVDSLSVTEEGLETHV